MIKIALPDAYTNISSTVVISYIHIVLYDCLNDFKLHNDVNKCEPSAIAKYQYTQSSFWMKMMKNIENHKNDQKNPKSTPNLLKIYR